MRLALTLILALAGCTAHRSGVDGADSGRAPTPTGPEREAQVFLSGYDVHQKKLYTLLSEAEWAANTRIVDGDDARTTAAAAANEAFAAYTGSEKVIGVARRLLEHREALTPLTIRQLQAVLYNAGDHPQNVPDLVKKRIEAEGKQVQRLYGYEFTVAGQPISPNAIDDKLRQSRDLNERLAVWSSSKDIGPVLKPGLVELRDLRNQVVQSVGYPDYYSYQVSDYDMTTAEMDAMMLRLQRELRPLYRELHTWVRYELAARFDQPVPDQLPAHWLPNRWGQDWSALVDVEGVDVDAAVAPKSPEWMVHSAEEFYVSLGFEALPASFWEKSSLYPVPADAGFKKNTHASAWHLDLDHDVRSLMSVEPNAEWYETTHHELGHVYYYLSYSQPTVPLVLRGGANRAFHEAVGSMMGLAAMQRPFLEGRGLVASGVKVDETRLLLKEALNYAVFIPFAAGTMASFERALYVENLPSDQFNQRWWELAAKYQGIVPPSPRGETYADALTKTHINDDPAQYYDYALSYFLLFQLHDHIAQKILHQDPRATNYFGNKETGSFLKEMLSQGATRDWREVTREATGTDLSAEPMVRYFDPLMAWLKEQNKARTYTLPEL